MSDLAAPRLLVLIHHVDAIVSLGLASALRGQPDLQVEIAGIDPAPSRQRRVLICDYPQALELARDDCVLVLTGLDREHAVRSALEAGVKGYLLQSCSPDELCTAVRTLGRGFKYLGTEIANRMADSLMRPALTGRESEVLGLLASGLCNKAIAQRLEIGAGTVKAHVKAVMSKLDAASRTEAASIAAQRGLLDVPAQRPMRPAARAFLPHAQSGGAARLSA